MSGIINTDDLEALVGDALQRADQEEKIPPTLNRISGINSISHPKASTLGKRLFALLLNKAKSVEKIGNVILNFPCMATFLREIFRSGIRGEQ